VCALSAEGYAQVCTASELIKGKYQQERVESKVEFSRLLLFIRDLLLQEKKVAAAREEEVIFSPATVAMTGLNVCLCVFTVRNSAFTRHRLPKETQRLGITWPSSIRAASSTTGRGRLQENLAKTCQR